MQWSGMEWSGVEWSGVEQKGARIQIHRIQIHVCVGCEPSANLRRESVLAEPPPTCCAGSLSVSKSATSRRVRLSSWLRWREIIAANSPPASQCLGRHRPLLSTPMVTSVRDSSVGLHPARSLSSSASDVLSNGFVCVCGWLHSRKSHVVLTSAAKLWVSARRLNHTCPRRSCPPPHTMIHSPWFP